MKLECFSQCKILHSPDPLSICIKDRRPLWGNADDGVIVSGIIVVKVRGVEEVKALQGTLHSQTEARGSTPVTRETALGGKDRMMGIQRV